MGFTSSLEENSGILTLLVVTSSDTDGCRCVFREDGKTDGLTKKIRDKKEKSRRKRLFT